MKIKECRSCEFVKLPKYHAGFTGKSGWDTWWQCYYHKKALREIKKCDKAAKNCD